MRVRFEAVVTIDLDFSKSLMLLIYLSNVCVCDCEIGYNVFSCGEALGVMLRTTHIAIKVSGI